MIADLHCHSRLSDGSLGIDDLVFFAKRAGLEFMALTDHDTMAGVTRAQVLGKRLGIEVLAGVEISCRDPDTRQPVHLLCYLPEKPDRLEGFLKATLDKRTAVGVEMLQAVMRYYPLTPEYAAQYTTKCTSIYRVHIMCALVDLGYDSQPYGALYEKLFGEEGSCRVRFEYPTIDEALQIVADANGIAVIAHPGEKGILPLCQRLAAQKRIQGLEVFHPRNDLKTREALIALCEEYRLIPTGGTDFHGAYAPRPNPLGTCMAPPDAVENLFRIKGKGKEKRKGDLK